MCHLPDRFTCWLHFHSVTLINQVSLSFIFAFFSSCVQLSGELIKQLNNSTAFCSLSVNVLGAELVEHSDSLPFVQGSPVDTHDKKSLTCHWLISSSLFNQNCLIISMGFFVLFFFFFNFSERLAHSVLCMIYHCSTFTCECNNNNWWRRYKGFFLFLADPNRFFFCLLIWLGLPLS